MRCETLYTADYEYVNVSRFAVLDIELHLENVDSRMNHPLS